MTNTIPQGNLPANTPANPPLAPPTSSLGYIRRAVVLSIGTSQVVGTCVFVATLVNSIWNVGKLLISTLSIKIKESKIKKLQCPTQQLKTTPHEQKDAIIQLGNLLSFDKATQEAAQSQLKENGHVFIVSLLSMIPFFGLLLGGAYARAIGAGDSSHSSIARGAEGISHFLLGRFPGIESLGRKAFYPLFLPDRITTFHRTDQQLVDRYPKLLKSTNIDVERGDGKKHSISCVELLPILPERKTMVLFAGNCMLGTDMSPVGLDYQKKGWNVLMVTMGGYPGSDQGLDTSEESTIQDVHAVIREIERRNVADIGVHGFSIGSTLAMHATQMSDRVHVAVLDKPLASAQKVAVTMVSNTLRKQELPFHLLPTAVIRGAIAPSFPIHKRVGGVCDKKGDPYYTDGLDNEEKAQKFTGTLLCIGGAQDSMMGYDWDEQLEGYNHSFAKDISVAHAGAGDGLFIESLLSHEPELPPETEKERFKKASPAPHSSPSLGSQGQSEGAFFS